MSLKTPQEDMHAIILSKAHTLRCSDASPGIRSVQSLQWTCPTGPVPFHQLLLLQPIQGCPRPYSCPQTRGLTFPGWQASCVDFHRWAAHAQNALGDNPQLPLLPPAPSTSPPPSVTIVRHTLPDGRPAALTSTGGQPVPIVHLASTPSCTSPSTKSAMGRSLMRATPSSTKRPRPAAATAAVRGRMAVPALPRNSSAPCTPTQAAPECVIHRYCRLLLCCQQNRGRNNTPLHQERGGTKCNYCMWALPHIPPGAQTSTAMGTPLILVPHQH